MAEITKLFLFFLAVFVCGQNVLCSDVRLEISPSGIDAMTTSPVQISCIPSKSLDLEAKYTMTINILGLDGKPIASLPRGSQIPHSSMNSSQSNVEGHIDDVVSYSYLRLTLFNPREEDSGLYQCAVYYLDNSYLLKEKTAQANLTYDEPDVESVMKYCKDKISEFDRKLEEQTQHFTELMNKISAQEKVNSDKDYICAFSAKYANRGSEAAGQTIVFDEIIMKEGEGYDENTGLFTAPRDGIYAFHVVLIMHSKNAYVDLKLEVNGEGKAGLSAGSESKYYDQSSVSIVLKLQLSDVVKVAIKSKSTQSAKLQTSEFSVFSGYLLRETP